MTDKTKKTILDVNFDDLAVDLDDIVPYADLQPAQAMAVLQVRRAVGELWFGRKEQLHMAEISDAEADGMEQRLATDGREDVNGRKLTDSQRRILAGQAGRARVSAELSRFRARQFELEIIAHLSAKQDDRKGAE